MPIFVFLQNYEDLGGFQGNARYTYVHIPVFEQPPSIPANLSLSNVMVWEKDQTYYGENMEWNKGKSD